MFYFVSFSYNYYFITPRVVKMEGENFDDSCEISDVEDELDCVLHGDDLSEILLGDDFGTDSDVIIARKKKKNSNYCIGFRGRRCTTGRHQYME